MSKPRTAEEIHEKMSVTLQVLTKSATIEEVDEAISEFKLWLGEQHEPNVIDGLVECRNAFLEMKEAQRTLIETEQRRGIKRKFDA